MGCSGGFSGDVEPWITVRLIFLELLHLLSDTKSIFFIGSLEVGFVGMYKDCKTLIRAFLSRPVLLTLAI